MKKLSLAIAACCAMTANYADAEVRINGFASIVAGKTLESDTTLYGYDNDISFKNESVFALQLSADLQENLTATAQIVARGSNDFDAEFEWAYLTYEFTDELQLSAGKMRIPFYRYSDYLDVSYAYRWIRPPQSVYGIPFSTYEGLSLLYNTQLGDWDSSLQVFYGGYEGEVDAVSEAFIDEAELTDFGGINWTVSYDWFSARAAYLVAEASVDIPNVEDDAIALNTLEATLQQYGLTDQASSLAIDEDDSSFFGLGFSIDYNDILFDAEYTYFEVEDSIITQQTQYYASIGYRMDDVIVHFTYEVDDDKHESSRFDTLASVPELAELNAYINGALEGAASKTNAFTIGARYDFHPAAALKVEYTSLDGEVNNVDTDVIAVAVDLVF
jgi:hypothetical protein